MGLLCLTVRVGDVVEVGDALAVKVEEKLGQRVKLVFATMLSPIRINATGIIPQRFSSGITGESRYVPGREPPATLEKESEHDDR